MFEDAPSNYTRTLELLTLLEEVTKDCDLLLRRHVLQTDTFALSIGYLCRDVNLRVH